MKDSKIQWTDHTFNPWIGCDQVSPGCLNCYAKDLMQDRYKRVQWGQGEERSRTSEAYWKEPVQWNKQAAIAGTRLKVFCASLADVFDEEVPAEWFQDLWKLIQATPNLDWLLLTKRPQNIQEFLYGERNGRLLKDSESLPNVWLGTTTEDQRMADERIPLLMKIPATVRFLSCEPLIEEVDLKLGETGTYPSGSLHAGFAERHTAPSECPTWYDWCNCRPDWVIIGGESGKGARPFNVDWGRSLIQQCKAADVPVFMKQLGALPYGLSDPVELSELKGKASDPEKWPEDLRVREFPLVEV